MFYYVSLFPILLLFFAFIFYVFKAMTYRKLQKAKKFEVLPDGTNLQIWQLNKKEYLKLSIAKFCSALISLALVIPGIYLIISGDYEAQPNTQIEFFTSPIFIIFCLLLIKCLIGTRLFYQHKRICYKLFYNNNFAEDVNLKKFNWFFKTKFRIVVFVTLHSFFLCILGIIFSRIIYKDIEKNNINLLK